jgi:sodium/pantothenate symporter
MVLLPLLGFMAGMLALGFYVRRQSAAGGFLSNYFVGGQSLGGFVLAMTMVAPYSSVSSFVGGPGMAYEIGFGWIYMAVIQTMTIFLVLGIFGTRVARLARRIHAVTIVDIIRHRYRSDALAAVAAFVIVLFFAASMVAQFVGGAQLFAAVTGYSYELGLVLFGIVVVIYTSIGGFRAVALTDTCCAIVMMLGIVLLFYYVLAAGGGFAAILEQLRTAHPAMLTPTAEGRMPISLYVSQWLLVGALTIALPQSVVRGISYRSSRDMHRAMIIGTVVIAFMNIAVNLVGVLGRGVLDVDAKALGGVDSVIPQLMAHVMPPELLGFAIIGPLAASISTISGVLIVASSAVVKDVYLHHAQKHGRDVPEERLRRLSMGVTAVLGVIVFILAVSPPSLIWLINMFAFGGLETAFFWVLVFGLFTRWANRTGALAAMAGGTVIYCAAMALGIKPLGLHPISVGITASLVLFLAGSYVGRRSERT